MLRTGANKSIKPDESKKMGYDINSCASMNLQKTARLIAQFYNQRLQPSGMRTTQFALLVMLGQMAPVSITRLAEQMGMDRTTLTRNLRLLERDGMVVGESGEDARVRMLSLTPKGKAAITEVQPYWEVAQSEFLKKFGKQRWNGLQKDLSDIASIISG